MKLTPNIDQSGQKARLRIGIIVLICGIGLTVAGAWVGSRSLLVAGVILIVSGAFMIFEATHAWCVLRAMGMKTRM